MTKRKAPFSHPDGSNCWTKDCKYRTVKAVSDNFIVPSFFKPELFPAPKPLGSWTNEDTELFKTPHGSRLYGFATVGSDEDWYVVTPTKYVSRKFNAKQRITGDQDVLAVDFRTFTSMASNGVPQALETMFSRQAESQFFEEYRNSWYASDPAVIHTYMRTIKSFSLNEREGKDGYKQRRHALRLSLNLEELLYRGRFNPTLSRSNAERVTVLATKKGENYLKELRAICPIEVDWKFGDKKQPKTG